MRRLFFSLAVLVIGLIGAQQAEAQCLGVEGIENDANIVKNELAAHRDAVLCQNTVWNVTQEIIFPFRAAGSPVRVYTYGKPTDNRRALFQVRSSAVGAVFKASYWDQDANGFYSSNNAELGWVRVDGGESLYGACPGGSCGEALISFGGPTTGQRIEHVDAWGARGWATIALERVAVGPSNGCYGAYVGHNKIGPSGNWPVSPSTATFDHLVDGIFFSCQDSLVELNDIRDVTDMSINIAGSPGTAFRNNYIAQTFNRNLGGIAMTDGWGEWDPNFTGVTVDNNTIEAMGGWMQSAIGYGFRTGHCTPELANYGAKIRNNVIRGSMAYGIILAGVYESEITGNQSYGTYAYSYGVSECEPTPLPAATAFVRESGQSEYLVTISGNTHDDVPQSFVATTQQETLRMPSLRP
jgi:hypothetical protein